MTEKLDNVMPRLLPLVRMFSSNVEGERINAFNALLRLLASNGLDIHALADRIEHGDNAPLNAGEMQQIYDRAYEKGFSDGAEHGRHSAVIAAQPIGTFATSVDDGVNGYSWQQIANHCALNKHLFYGRDLEFVESVAEQLTRFSHPKPKQATWLKDLFMRSFSGRIE